MQQIGHATVIAADGKLILFNDLGELILARISQQSFAELDRTSVLGGEICWTQPALSRGRLFVRNHSRVACVFLGNPETLQPAVQSRLTTTAEIPQGRYVDWASVVLGIEPEYAFDLPSWNWLWLWFRASLGIMAGSLVLMLCIVRISPLRICSLAVRETAYWWLVLIVGWTGTTLLSLLMSEFVFTWPVSLYAGFQLFVDRIQLSRKRLTRSQRVAAAASGCFFIANCLLYFLICRRLSLVFEWVFLGGFIAAVPFALASRAVSRQRRLCAVWKSLTAVAAFAAFYWSAAAFLYLRV